MLGHYGWIMALQDIDHPDADRHGGRIYLHTKDLRPGSTLKQGDEVTFFLYVDENGLGAEDCFATNDPHPPQPPAMTVQTAPPRKYSDSRSKVNRVARAKRTEQCLNAAAQEFVPTVLVPLHAEENANVGAAMNPKADEFVPAPPGLGPVFNTKRFFDDDDSSDDDTESTASGFSGRVLVAP